MTVTLRSHEHSQWGELFIKYNDKEYTFPCYLPSGEIFNLDPSSLVRLKCVVLTVITPIMSIVRSIYWLSKAIFMCLSEVYRYLDNAEPSNGPQESIIDVASDSIRALFYGVALTGCSLSGILAPFWARLNYGHLEGTLNRHSDGPHRNKFYLAFCFQRVAILPKNFKENSAQVIEKLDKYIKLIDIIHSVRDAIRNLSRRQVLDEGRKLLVELKVLSPAA
ncbi:MAG: hypothetical protein H0W88_09280 [Parachlamydiaceae bacterium]|nr:hypothetical protein [Parachlamydiaceae bacterium]